MTAAIDYKTLVQDDRIHASLYTDPRIFDDELERIFRRGWVFVGHDSEIPGAGDFVTRRIGTEPVIMVRGADGGVAVLVNRCMHRGTMLCPADRGRARTFSCPYHGWTYDISGALLGVPYPGGYASFDKSAHGLARAPRVSSYRGFVFASLSPAGISLAEHLGLATRLIDRSCDLSPVGEIELSAGLDQASVRRQLEGAARERQRRLPSRVRPSLALHDGALAVPARGRRREGDQGGRA